MSVRLRIHPSLRELNRLADRELEESRQREVHEHLGECQQCRNQVALMRDLGRAAREISHPSPPEDALSRILERRAAGDRVIIPVASALRTSRHRKAISIAAGVGGALLAATLLLLPANEASAGASDLRFDPAQTEPGDHIEVTYLPTSALAAEEVLYLRGAFRRPGDPVPRRGLPGAFRVELRPNPDGTYAGTMQMPSDVVFGYFAVEDSVASEIDLKEGRFWPLLAHDNGAPTREALREQLRVVTTSDVDFGLRAADMLLEYYPDDWLGLNRKLSYELIQTVGAEREELVGRHRAKLPELRDALEQRADDLAGLEALWRYANQLDEAALTDRVASYILLNSSGARSATAARIRLEVELLDVDPRQKLEAYEREWMLAGLSNSSIAGTAFRRAVEGKDPEAVLRWARRLKRVRPGDIEVIAEALDRFPVLRESVKDGIRAEVLRVKAASPERRRLNETTEQLLARDRRRVSLLLGTLGQLLFEEGRYEEAIQTLELAVEEGGWSPDALRSLAESYAAVGDVLEALTLFAVVVASESDPDVQRVLQLSLQRRFGRLFPDAADWSAQINAADEQITRRLINDAGQPIRPAGNPRVWNRNGEARSLETLVAGRVSIVVFWAGSPWTESTGLSDSTRLQALMDRGINILTISETPQSNDLEALLDDGEFDLQVYFDHKWEAARSLRALGVPYYYVVDQRGGFYYAEDMVQAIQLAESLQRRAAPAA